MKNCKLTYRNKKGREVVKHFKSFVKAYNYATLKGLAQFNIDATDYIRI